MSCKHPVRTKWHTAIMGFHSQTEISKPLTAALNLQMFAVCTLCWGMQSIVIPVSKSAFCGAYNALWSQSSNSGINGDIRLPSNSGLILHWCHCCDLSTENKPMDKSKSLVRFSRLKKATSEGWRHLTCRNSLDCFSVWLRWLHCFISCFADWSCIGLKLWTGLSMALTYPHQVHRHVAAWMRILLTMSLECHPTLWMHIPVTSRNVTETLKTDFVPCCAQNIEQILI
jgi:hypothetical protein